jgi:hypothetical protein
MVDTALYAHQRSAHHTCIQATHHRCTCHCTTWAGITCHLNTHQKLHSMPAANTFCRCPSFISSSPNHQANNGPQRNTSPSAAWGSITRRLNTPRQVHSMPATNTQQKVLSFL